MPLHTLRTNDRIGVGYLYTNFKSDRPFHKGSVEATIGQTEKRLQKSRIVKVVTLPRFLNAIHSDKYF